jgi:hypothetical protein
MPAALSLRVYTGTNAGTESSAVTGIDLISADNATNSLGNRQANPITVGTNSFEKWLKLKVDTAPANAVTNFQVWGDGSVMANTTLNYGFTATGATPTASTSTVATTNFTTATAAAKAQWDTASLTALNATTRYLVFQLAVDSNAGPGNWTQETINYSYDET